MTPQITNGGNGTRRTPFSALYIYTFGLTSECCKFIPLVP